MSVLSFSGTVIKGLGLGKKLGFPTLNLDPSCAPRKFKHGVYGVTVKTPAGIFKGAMHFGPRHTLPGAPISLEIHCVGLNEDLYGKKVEVQVGRYLRQIKKFTTKAELKQQIRKDIQEAIP